VTVMDTESATRPDVATTVVAPAANAETFPLLSIVATCGPRETQVTLAFEITAPEEFLTVAVSDPRAPTLSASDVGAIEILLAVAGDGLSGSPPHAIVAASAATATPRTDGRRGAPCMFDLIAGVHALPIRARSRRAARSSKCA